MRKFVFVMCCCTALACGGEATAPRQDLSCTNTPIPPDRFTVPHRWADTTWLFFDANDPHAGKPLGFIVRPFTDGHCITLQDSIYLKSP